MYILAFGCQEDLLCFNSVFTWRSRSYWKRWGQRRGWRQRVLWCHGGGPGVHNCTCRATLPQVCALSFISQAESKLCPNCFFTWRQKLILCDLEPFVIDCANIRQLHVSDLSEKASLCSFKSISDGQAVMSAVSTVKYAQMISRYVCLTHLWFMTVGLNATFITTKQLFFFFF